MEYYKIGKITDDRRRKHALIAIILITFFAFFCFNVFAYDQFPGEITLKLDTPQSFSVQQGPYFDVHSEFAPEYRSVMNVRLNQIIYSFKSFTFTGFVGGTAATSGTDYLRDIIPSNIGVNYGLAINISNVFSLSTEFNPYGTEPRQFQSFLNIDPIEISKEAVGYVVGGVRFVGGILGIK